MTVKCLEGIDVAILAGGLGTRIQGVLGDTPKVLAPIGGKLYLDHLLDWLASFGTDHVVLCLGHLANSVIDHVAGRDMVETVVEPEPLGTGGALRFARPRLQRDPVLVINGDTWIGTDLCSFINSHRQSGAMISVLCAPVEDVARYGSIELDQDRIVRFLEKSPTHSGPGLINAGAYLFTQAGIDELSESTGSSLERDFLQHLPARSINGFTPEHINFIDIGTPNSLVAADAVLTGAKLR